METQNYMNPPNEPTKKGDENGTFWRTPEALNYERITQDLLLSDIPAYRAVYHLLAPYGKVIVDYGCFQGDSSARIASLGAKVVIGVDINVSFIDQARQKHSTDNLQFVCISNDKPIALPSGVANADDVVMTFVHPVIPRIDTLQLAFRQISEILISGGRLIMLGLHSNSFDQQFRFISYGHKMPVSGVYRDGEAFSNKLIQNNGNILQFDDYCWTEETLSQLLTTVGFKTTEFISLFGNTQDELGDIIRKSIAEVEIGSGKKFLDEFVAPLHQVIIAQK